MQLSIIIVSYNVKDYLWQCLTSVEKAIKGLDAEVIVFDNHSHDATVESLQPLFPHVKFISSNHNLGFARGNNRAIRQSEGKYVLLLNPDTIVAEGTIQRALKFMDAHPKAGGCGVRMMDAKGVDAKESRRGIPTPMTSFFKFTKLCSRFPKNHRIGRYYMGWLPWDEPGKIETISGAFFLLRREALEAVGLLDEDFFMYGEDIDLSYRLLKGGWENWYLPLPILHYKGESTQKSSFRYVHVFYEAMLIFCKKHYREPYRLLLPILRFSVRSMAWVALCSVALNKARKSMGLVDRKLTDPFYVFHVRPDHMQLSQTLTSEKGLWAEFHDANALALGNATSWTSKQQVFMVFDATAFSYEEMFQAMHDHFAEKASMAVYYPSENMVITEKEIIKA